MTDGRWSVWYTGRTGRPLRVGSAGTRAAALAWVRRLAPRRPGRWAVADPAPASRPPVQR